MDFETRIINKSDNAENSKLLSLFRSRPRTSPSTHIHSQFESNLIRVYTRGRMEADLIIGLFIYEIRVVTREMMIERGW